jgi:hypothetical protein
MATKLVHVGFGNYLAADRVLDISVPSSAPIQRVVRKAKQEKIVIDVTAGRRTKAVLFMDTGAVVLAGITPQTARNRVAAARAG